VAFLRTTVLFQVDLRGVDLRVAVARRVVVLRVVALRAGDFLYEAVLVVFRRGDVVRLVLVVRGIKFFLPSHMRSWFRPDPSKTQSGHGFNFNNFFIDRHRELFSNFKPYAGL
jgi:hypothetical protein